MATIVGPYTNLAFEVAGFLAGAAVLVMLTGRRSAWAAVPAVVAVFLVVLVVPALWGGAGGLDHVRASLPTAPGTSDVEQCFIEGGRSDELAFARWLEQRIPPTATLAYDAGKFDTPCLQYALLPRLIVSRSEQPQFMAYAAPRDAAAQARLRAERRLPPDQRHIEFMAPDLALERLR